LYALGKSSFGWLGTRFGVSRSTTYYWMRQAAATIDAPTLRENIPALAYDAMWHFLHSKKANAGCSKPWIMAQAEAWPGDSVVVMRQPSNACLTK
jgi:hypothetical protein